jgi:hypothetical protein
MIELAKVNNPTAHFKVMDCRQISELQNKYDGIAAGFCLPYLSPLEVTDLVQSCRNLLNAAGILYLSFVEGEESLSGYQVNNVGDKMFFHYYEANTIEQLLSTTGFHILKTYRLGYDKANSEREIHTVFISRKMAR